MASLETPVCDFGLAAPDFSLPDVYGEFHSLQDCCGENGLLVMFICNHCPYVKAILERLVRDTRELNDRLGLHSVAIMSNDPNEYQEDSHENMRRIAETFEFPFPYLFDESQAVARDYGAVCTPDFFGYNRALELQYRGRLDASGRQKSDQDLKRELFEAMKEVAETGACTQHQVPSIGCSIKWKE